MIYLLTAIGLTPGGSSTVHIYTQTVHRTTQNKQYTEEHNNLLECGPCPVLARFTLAFALQLRKKHGKTSVIYSRINDKNSNHEKIICYSYIIIIIIIIIQWPQRGVT